MNCVAVENVAAVDYVLDNIQWVCIFSTGFVKPLYFVICICRRNKNIGSCILCPSRDGCNGSNGLGNDCCLLVLAACEVVWALLVAVVVRLRFSVFTWDCVVHCDCAAMVLLLVPSATLVHAYLMATI